jgi:acyl-CoA thioester hydrolase
MMEEFKFFAQLEVRISDINYGGHLGNDRFLSLCQDARIQYLKQFGYSEAHIGSQIGLIMLESHLFYIKQVSLGEVLCVGVRIGEIKSRKFTMEYNIHRLSDKMNVAYGHTIMTGFDYEQQKIVQLPVEFIDKIKAFETK